MSTSAVATAEAPKIAAGTVRVRPLDTGDVPAADRIFRVAFGTFLGLPDPSTFGGDSAYVSNRLQASPDSAFAAEVDGEVAGSNFATRWGSFGFFGPLTVDPRSWDRGLGAALMAPIMERFDVWGVRHAGLFTFPQSTKHLGLYQKFGFRPRALTMIMQRDVSAHAPSSTRGQGWKAYSELDEAERSVARSACRDLTNSLFEGLDLTSEVNAVDSLSLGDTVLLGDGDRIDGFAVCHVGAGTEGGSGTCYVKFGATRDAATFQDLLDACTSFARESGAPRLLAGVNTAREEAYETVRSAGFRILVSGIAMHRPNEAGFSRPGAFVLDDWR